MAVGHNQRPGDQSRSTLVSEERIAPLNENDRPVPEAGEVHDMDEKPCPPREKSGQMAAGEHADRPIASDRREIALVPVMEAFAPLTANRVDHISSGRAAALHGGRRPPRYRLLLPPLSRPRATHDA